MNGCQFLNSSSHVAKMTQSVVSRADSLINPMHVVILHEKLGKTREDRFMVNIAQGLRYCDHSVTFLTSYFDPYDCLPELNVGF